MRSVTVEDLLQDTLYHLEILLVAGEKGLSRRITYANVQIAGLALAGHTKHLKANRIQIFAKNEISYLRAIPEKESEERLDQFFRESVSCVIVTENQRIPRFVAEAAERHEVPLFVTPLPNIDFLDRINRFLEDHLSERVSLHGVLVDVLGVGILIRGESGIGKSETALDLIVRGHRLVADDIVEVQKVPPAALLGKGAELIRYHMEIRGLGVLNIRDMFGVSAIRERKKIEIICHLVEWDDKEEYDRLGLDHETYNILGVEVPYLRLPVRPGRNMSTIIEIAARNQLLKLQGHNSAEKFQKNVMRKISQASRDVPTLGKEIE